MFSDITSDHAFPASAVTSLVNSPPLDRGPLIFLAVASFFVALNLFQKGYRLFVPTTPIPVDASTAADFTSVAGPLSDIEQGHRQAVNQDVISEQLEEALRRKWMVNDLVSLYNASRLDESEPRNITSTAMREHPKALTSNSCHNSKAGANSLAASRPTVSCIESSSSRSFSISAIGLNDESDPFSDVSVSLSVNTIESYATAPDSSLAFECQATVLYKSGVN